MNKTIPQIVYWNATAILFFLLVGVMAAWSYKVFVVEPLFVGPSEEFVTNIKNNDDLTDIKEVFLFYIEKDSEIANGNQNIFKGGVKAILWITFGACIVLILNTIWIIRYRKVDNVK